MNAEPFQIDIEQSVLDDLHRRLQRTRRALVVSNARKEDHWEFGTSPGFLRDLLEYWRAGYEWRQHESKLNALPQFKARIEAADLHFVHVKSIAPNALPVLLLHGWPDSFYRFYKVIPMIGVHFDVVAPSLPGFAFSSPPQHSMQWNRRTAHLLWRLMTEVLGYEQFAVAGGDGGSPLAQILAIDHPEAVIAIHLTDLGWHVTSTAPAQASKAEQKYFAASKKQFMKDSAYAMVQTTRPRSLAAGLNDSPAGLASWIVDRFHSWADGDIEARFTKDELLTNIMLYWVTQTIGSSMFGYYAEAHSPSLTATEHVEVPVALALFPKDIGGIPPRSLAERTLNVQRWTEMPRGGHFAALEEPQLFARDLIGSLQIFTNAEVDRALDKTPADESPRYPLDPETMRPLS